jgi:predicted nucleic acid-binding protein
MDELKENLKALERKAKVQEPKKPEEHVLLPLLLKLIGKAR